jgi:YfiH family protein
MIRRTKSGVVWFEFDLLAKFPKLLHFHSTRKGGQSKEPYNSFNLGFGEDNAADVLANRNKLANLIGFSGNDVVAQNQVHGTHLEVIHATQRGSGFGDKTNAIKNCDAMISNQPGICLWAFGADCIPILFYDDHKKVIGVAHAGWKGSLQNIVGKTILAMQQHFGSNPDHIIVALGAGIGVKYYEVGDDVVKAVFTQFAIDEPFLVKNPRTGRFHLDLYNTNLFLLYQAGISPENIQISDLCTFENKDLFFSARRDKITGRQVAGIMLS